MLRLSLKEVIGIVVVCLIAGCAKNDPIPFDASYFPLHVGDSREYAYHGFHGYVRSVNTEVTGKADVNGKSYYVMRQTYFYHDAQSPPRHDTVYYRVGNNGFVYSLYAYDKREVNEFRLGAAPGEKWKIKVTEDQTAWMSASFDAEHPFGNNTLQNCKVFSFDIPLAVDDETTTVLAPGLGMISRSNPEAGSISLRRATINGVTYEF